MEQQLRKMEMEDPEDEGLRAVMGERFRDVRKVSRDQEKTSGENREKAGVRQALVWLIPMGFFGFWYSRGLMDPGAAIPCMVVCGSLSGFYLGNGRK